MKKVNILLDDATFDRLKAVTFALDKSPTELLKPFIEQVIRDNAETVKKKLLFTADQFTDADKTVIAKNGDNRVEEHLVTKTQQVTDGGKQQEDDADTLRTILTETATREPAAVFVADDGYRYVRAWRKLQRALEAAGIKAKPSQPKLNGKGQRAYRLDNATEAPQATETRANDL